MRTEMIHADLPSRHFEPRIYGVGAWTHHLHFAYDLVAVLKPGNLVELGVDRGESYFAFCQSAAENRTGTRCFGVDTWRGDQHAGGYDDTTFAQVSEHNRANYEAFSTLIRASFGDALEKFEADSIDLLHVDGLHTESAVRHDLDSWMPKVRPGGIILLHDVDVRSRDFGVWKVWEALRERGRSWTFHDGPGLGVWQKPPRRSCPGSLSNCWRPLTKGTARWRNITVSGPRKCSAGSANIGATERFAIRRSRSKQLFSSSTRRTGRIARKTRFLRESDMKSGKSSGLRCPRERSPPRCGSILSVALTTIDVASISLTQAGRTYFSAPGDTGFDSIALSGDVERLAHPSALRLKITGVDPQLYLPVVPLPSAEEPLVLHMRLRVSAGLQ